MAGSCLVEPLPTEVVRLGTGAEVDTDEVDQPSAAPVTTRQQAIVKGCQMPALRGSGRTGSRRWGQAFDKP